MTDDEKASKAAERIHRIVFGSVYPLYVQKAQKKGRTQEEVDKIVEWLTGYSQRQILEHIERRSDFATFFAQAPAFAPNAAKITGVVCGVRVEDITDPVIRKIRYLDKLIDELAKGKAMDKILRQ